MNILKKYDVIMFDQIKHIDEDGGEYWSARELQLILKYKEWRKFKGVIEKAKVACFNSKNNIHDHFVGADKMVKTGDSITKIVDYKLSCYACYSNKKACLG